MSKSHLWFLIGLSIGGNISTLYRLHKDIKTQCESYCTDTDSAKK